MGQEGSMDSAGFSKFLKKKKKKTGMETWDFWMSV